MRRTLVHRGAVILLLVLAVLLLAADAGEYPGLSRAGVRALTRGAVPLLVVAAMNLWAINAGRFLRALAIGANVLLVAAMVPLIRPGAPPLVWMVSFVAVLLVGTSVSLLMKRDTAAP